MKITKWLIFTALFCLSELGVAAEIYLPNIKRNATGTISGGKAMLDVNVSIAGQSTPSGSAFTLGDPGSPSLAVRKDADGSFSGVSDGDYAPLQVDSDGKLKVSGSFTANEVAVAEPGDPVPNEVKVIAGSDGSAVRAIKTDSGGAIAVDVESSVLPSGAATAANQSTANSSLSNIDSNTSAISGKLPSTLGQKNSAGSLSVTVSSDQTAIPVIPLGRSAINRTRYEYASGPVDDSGYTEVVSSVGATDVAEVEIFDSSGQTMILATGTLGNESDQIYIFPGGNGRIPLEIAAGTRVSVKAAGSTASVGELVINFYGN